MNAKSKPELIGHVINLANTGESDLQECTSVGVSVGSTETDSYFETPGPYYLRIGRWDDYGKETYIIGFSSAVIHQLRLNRATRLIISGSVVDYTQSSHSTSVILNYNVLTDTVSGSEQFENSEASGHNIALSRIIVNELFCRKSLRVDLNNAKLSVRHLQGKISDVYLHTDHHDYILNFSSASLSTDGNVGIQVHSKKGHKIKEASEFHLDDADDGQVVNIHSDGGRVSGKAFDKMHPNLIEQMPINSWEKEYGFGISIGLNSHRINSISFQNSCEGYTESIQVTTYGLKMIRTDFYHGAKIELNIPYVLIQRLMQVFNPPTASLPIEILKKRPTHKKPENKKNFAKSQEKHIPTILKKEVRKKIPSIKKNQDFQLQYHGPFNSQKYAIYFDPLASQEESRTNKPQSNMPLLLMDKGINIGLRVVLNIFHKLYR